MWKDPDLSVGADAPLYELLWRVAFHGGWGNGWTARGIKRLLPRVPTPVRSRVQIGLTRAALRRPVRDRAIVKTVDAYYSLEWIADRFDPEIVLVWRSPMNMLASWLERGWFPNAVHKRRPVRRRFEDTAVWPPPTDLGAELVIWTMCARLTILLELAEEHPQWHVYRHETLALNPIGEFRSVFDALGLVWSDEVETFLRSHDKEGPADSQFRVASRETDSWKRRLTYEQAGAALRVVERFAGEWQPGTPLRLWAEGVLADSLHSHGAPA
jgi:hypothetical protein